MRVVSEASWWWSYRPIVVGFYNPLPLSANWFGTALGWPFHANVQTWDSGCRDGGWNLGNDVSHSGDLVRRCHNIESGERQINRREQTRFRNEWKLCRIIFALGGKVGPLSLHMHFHHGNNSATFFFLNKSRIWELCGSRSRNVGKKRDCLIRGKTKYGAVFPLSSHQVSNTGLVSINVKKEDQCFFFKKGILFTL